MSSTNPLRFCIVGTGFSGTAALVHLVKALIRTKRSSDSIEIITVEERSKNGPGFPYDYDELLPSHLCNNQAGVMSLYDNDFYDWMLENREFLINNHFELIKETHPLTSKEEWLPDADAFYPRALFGHYLEDRYYQYFDLAKDYNIDIVPYNGYSVTDGYRNNNKFYLEIINKRSGKPVKLDGFHRVLLSTGHWTVASASNSVTSKELNSPYPFYRVKRRIKQWLNDADGRKLRVFVKGMGPSGIDAVMSLVSDGSFQYNTQGQIVGFTPAGLCDHLEIFVGSRCGFFPAVRGDKPDYEFKYLTEDTFTELEKKVGHKLLLEDILSLIDAELKHATSGEINWSDVSNPKFTSAFEKLNYDKTCSVSNNLIHSILLKVRRMKFYRYLSGTEKQMYDKLLDTHFIRTAVPIPLSNAEKLIALFESGILKSVKMGYDISPNPIESDNGFELSYLNESGYTYIPIDAVIYASGQSFNLHSHPSQLVKNLLEKDELVAYEEENYVTGGVSLDSYDSYQVMCRDSKTGVVKPSEFIASFGVLTRFWQNERNFSAAFVEAAVWMAEQWSQLAKVEQDDINVRQSEAEIVD